MPKISSTKAPKPLPMVPGTPISRRLRTRPAKGTKPARLRDDTDSEYGSDEDFEVKKIKPKPKPITRSKRVRQVKKTVTSFRSVAETEFEESSQSQNESDTSKVTTSTTDWQYRRGLKESDLDAIQDTNTQESDRKINEQSKIGKNPGSVIRGKNVSPAEAYNVSSGPSTEEKESTQSSSEEFKTPKSDNDDGSMKILADISDRSNYPDIVEEMRTGNVKYITKHPEHQQIELQERKKLLEMKKEMDDYIRKFRKEHLTKTLAISSAFKNVLFCAVLENLNKPDTFEEMVTNLPEFNINGYSKNTVRGLTVISEDMESVDFHGSDEEYDMPLTFPHPKQFAKTPQHGHLRGQIFSFVGSEVPAVAPSASKLARLAKPGEVYYSERGSPIVPPVLGKCGSSQSLYSYPKSAHTVEVTDFDGEKIKVDLVLAGGAVEKSKLFNEFVTDVRGIAATRSTVKHNRIQPARVPTRSRKGASTSTVASTASKRR